MPDKNREVAELMSLLPDFVESQFPYLEKLWK